MATSSRLVLNYAGIGALLKSAGVAADLKRRADRVADQARRMAPRSNDGDGITYAEHIDSWTVENKSRVVGRAGCDLGYAQKVEANHRVLGRAIDAAAG